jgi:hypothetical protein
MKKVIFGILILAIIFFFLYGGLARIIVGILNSRSDSDVTSSPKYNFSSFAGTVWKTKAKVALADLKQYTGRHATTMLPPDCFDPTHPKYKPPPHLEKVITVLPVGTRLRIEGLMKDNGNWGGVRVTASLDDGTIVNLERGLLAKNGFIFRGSSESKEWGVDPDLLEKAE